MLFAWRFITVMLVALSMALSFCHLMEMPPRLRWEPSLWMAATTFEWALSSLRPDRSGHRRRGGDRLDGARLSRAQAASRVPTHVRSSQSDGPRSCGLVRVRRAHEPDHGDLDARRRSERFHE